ncbi:MAG: hypothetical protein LBT45_03535 [Rickettsiales bacterium]|jgi:hypothetical protein|nr:hypothetical protein [Rickettsiales bacterium]
MVEKLFNGRTEKIVPLMDLFLSARDELETAVDERKPVDAHNTLLHVVEFLGESETLFKGESWESMMVKTREDIKKCLDKFSADYANKDTASKALDYLLGTADEYVEKLYDVRHSLEKII